MPILQDPPQPEDTKVQPKALMDPTFRSGTITAVAILLGFSLNFLSRWALYPSVWTVYDAMAVVPLIAGTGLQVWSIVMLLSHDSLRVAFYDRATRLFLIGLCVVAIGIAAAVLIELLGLSGPDLVLRPG